MIQTQVLPLVWQDYVATNPFPQESEFLKKTWKAKYGGIHLTLIL